MYNLQSIPTEKVSQSLHPEIVTNQRSNHKHNASSFVVCNIVKLYLKAAWCVYWVVCITDIVIDIIDLNILSLNLFI